MPVIGGLRALKSQQFKKRKKLLDVQTKVELILLISKGFFQ